MVDMMRRLINSNLTYSMAVVWLLTLAAHYLEPVLFPVVTNFNIASAQRQGQTITISGTLVKARPTCIFAGVTAQLKTADDTQHVLLKFMDNKMDDTANRPEGYQEWGPWVLGLPDGNEPGTVVLTSAHRCHPVWMTSTPNARIKVEGAAP